MVYCCVLLILRTTFNTVELWATSKAMNMCGSSHKSYKHFWDFHNKLADWAAELHIFNINCHVIKSFPVLKHLCINNSDKSQESIDTRRAWRGVKWQQRHLVTKVVMLRYRDLLLLAPESRGAMNSLRKWLYRPRRDDKSLLAKFW